MYALSHKQVQFIPAHLCDTVLSNPGIHLLFNVPEDDEVLGLPQRVLIHAGRQLERLSDVTRSVSLLARCRVIFSVMELWAARLWRFSGLRVYRIWGFRRLTKAGAPGLSYTSRLPL